MAVIGVDIGTTGCKAVLFDEQLDAAAAYYQGYELYLSGDEKKELDPLQVRQAVLNCIKKCCAGGRGETVKAISFSAQGEAVVPVDREGQALDRVMVSFDTRNRHDLDELRKWMEPDELNELTGLPLHTMFTLPKLMWIRRVKPELYRKTWKFMCFSGYLAFTLGAEPVMDYSMASRTMLFDVRMKRWHPQILERCRLEAAKMPRLVPGGTAVGTVSTAMAAELGLPEGTVIASGGHDQICCALGVGVLNNGMAMNSMGTTDTILAVSAGFHSGRQQRDFNIPCGCYYDGGTYANHSFVLTTGSIIKWCRSNLFGKEQPGFDRLEEQLKHLDDPTGMFFIPHFAGSGTPRLNSLAKGTWTGIGLETSTSMLYKAVLEGIAYEGKANIDNMEQAGIAVRTIRCIGGGAASSAYLQIKADIFGKTVEQAEISEAGCFGAALLAIKAIDQSFSLTAAAAAKVKVKQIFRPRQDQQIEYQFLFDKYLELHQAMDVFYR